VLLDGRVQGRAGLHRLRPESAASQDEAAELSGFEFRLDLRGIDGLTGRVRLGARVTLLNGESTELPPVPLMIGPACESVASEPDVVGAPRATRHGKASRTRLLCSRGVSISAVRNCACASSSPIFAPTEGLRSQCYRRPTDP
jgi:hypothetical protein